MKQFTLQQQALQHGSRFRRRCVHSKLMYTATDVCTLFTSFPCYIEFYVDMDPEEMEGLEELVAPNGRHNLFKCSMCDIFCIVRKMLPLQYLFRLSVIFSQSAAALADEGPPPPAGPHPPAPAAANGRHVYAKLHSYTTCVQVLRLQDFPSSCPAAPPILPPRPPPLPYAGRRGRYRGQYRGRRAGRGKRRGGPAPENILLL